jgi:hypothetical protein
MPDIPGTFTLNGVQYVAYSNAPMDALDARGVTFRGMLAHRGGVAGPLHYIVVAIQPATPLELAWESEAGAGSGSLSERGIVCYNVSQGKGSVTRSVQVPGFVPHPSARAWMIAGFKALLSPEMYDAWRGLFK